MADEKKVLYDTNKVNWDNEYFNTETGCYDNEKKLYTKGTSEVFKIGGLEFDYFVLDFDTTKDVVNGEDVAREAKRRFKFSGYMESLPTMTPQYILDGIAFPEVFSMLATIEHFSEASTYSMLDGVRTERIFDEMKPKIGDYIKSHADNKFYTIINVKATKGQTQFLQTPSVYEFKVRLMKKENFNVKEDEKFPELQMEDLRNIFNSKDIFEINDTALDEFDDIKYESEDPRDEIDDIFGGW